MPFIYLEDVAIADITFEAAGENLSELFKSAAEAVFDSTADVKTIEPRNKKTIRLENDNIRDLLYDFLSEILYIKDADYFVFCRADVSVEKNNKYKMSATLYGENIDTKKHQLRNDIKAITFHMFEVKKSGKGWKARVVMDL